MNIINNKKNSSNKTKVIMKSRKHAWGHMDIREMKRVLKESFFSEITEMY